MLVLMKIPFLAGDGERLTNGEKTLITLEECGRIHMDQPDELIKLMKDISRCDLIQPIKKFSNGKILFHKNWK